MPATPPTSPRFGAPRHIDTDEVAFSQQVNGVTDALDAKAAKFGHGPVSALPAAVAANTGSWYRATDINAFLYCDGASWATVVEFPIGGVLDWPVATADPPTYATWLPMNGQTVNRDDFPLLASAWGITAPTFVVPDRRGRSPVGAGAGPGLTNRVAGALYGHESFALGVPHMPSHGHGASTHLAGSHVHGIHNSGEHQHSYWQASWVAGYGANDFGPLDPGSNPYYWVLHGPTLGWGTTQGNGLHAHGMDSAGSHAHTVVVEANGGGQPYFFSPPSSVTRYFVRAA